MRTRCNSTDDAAPPGALGEHSAARARVQLRRQRQATFDNDLPPNALCVNTLTTSFRSQKRQTEGNGCRLPVNLPAFLGQELALELKRLVAAERVHAVVDTNKHLSRSGIRRRNAGPQPGRVVVGRRCIDVVGQLQGCQRIWPSGHDMYYCCCLEDVAAQSGCSSAAIATCTCTHSVAPTGKTLAGGGARGVGGKGGGGEGRLCNFVHHGPRENACRGHADCGALR